SRAFIYVNSLGQPRLGKSGDGGLHWDLFPLSSAIKDLYFISSKVGFGYDRYANGIYKTENGGLTWTYITPEIRLYDIGFRNAEEGWITDWNGIVYYTTDGMKHYTRTNCGGELINSFNPLFNQVVLAAARSKI